MIQFSGSRAQAADVKEFRKIPVKRLFFVMKHIAEEDRWAEYAQALTEVGHTDFIMDLATVEALKGAVKRRKAIPGKKGKTRGDRINASATCGGPWGGHPTPPPRPPKPDPPDGGTPKKKRPKSRPKSNPPRDKRKAVKRKAPVK